jgi:threonylcarbamoyladenosine tRNA methylthiotransferase MtaB
MLRILSAKKLRAFYEKHLGETRLVLFEADHKEGFMHGWTDNYIKVKVPHNPSFINQLRMVTLKEIDEKGEVLVEHSEFIKQWMR